MYKDEEVAQEEKKENDGIRRRGGERGGGRASGRELQEERRWGMNTRRWSRRRKMIGVKLRAGGGV